MVGSMKFKLKFKYHQLILANKSNPNLLTSKLMTIVGFSVNQATLKIQFNFLIIWGGGGPSVFQGNLTIASKYRTICQNK